MAIRIECDLCGNNIPTESSIQKLLDNETKIADLCFNCMSQIKQAINQKKAARLQQKPAAQQPAGQPADQQPNAPKAQ